MGIRNSSQIKIIQRGTSNQRTLAGYGNNISKNTELALQPLPFNLDSIFFDLKKELSPAQVKSFAKQALISLKKNPPSPLKLPQKTAEIFEKLNLVEDSQLTLQGEELFTEFNIWPIDFDFATPAKVTPKKAYSANIQKWQDESVFRTGKTAAGVPFYTNGYIMEFDTFGTLKDDLEKDFTFTQIPQSQTIEDLWKTGTGLIKNKKKSFRSLGLFHGRDDSSSSKKYLSYTAISNSEGKFKILNPIYLKYLAERYGDFEIYSEDSLIKPCFIIKNKKLVAAVMPARIDSEINDGISKAIMKTYRNFDFERLF